MSSHACAGLPQPRKALNFTVYRYHSSTGTYASLPFNPGRTKTLPLIVIFVISQTTGAHVKTNPSKDYELTLHGSQAQLLLLNQQFVTKLITVEVYSAALRFSKRYGSVIKPYFYGC